MNRFSSWPLKASVQAFSDCRSIQNDNGVLKHLCCIVCILYNYSSISYLFFNALDLQNVICEKWYLPSSQQCIYKVLRLNTELLLQRHSYYTQHYFLFITGQSKEFACASEREGLHRSSSLSLVIWVSGGGGDPQLLHSAGVSVRIYVKHTHVCVCECVLKPFCCL